MLITQICCSRENCSLLPPWSVDVCVKRKQPCVNDYLDIYQYLAVIVQIYVWFSINLFSCLTGTTPRLKVSCAAAMAGRKFVWCKILNNTCICVISFTPVVLTLLTWQDDSQLGLWHTFILDSWTPRQGVKSQTINWINYLCFYKVMIMKMLDMRQVM